MSYTVHFQDGENSSSFKPLSKVSDARSAALTMINRLDGEGEDFKEVSASLGTTVYEWRSATGARIWVKED